VATDNWSDRIRLDGDFRYRYERTDPEGSDTRRRNRIRARVNVKADLADDLEVGFGLATGGDDPVSTNQTLGGGGSSKDVSLNLAYADWEVMDGLHLIGGKFKNPLYKAGKQALMWDGDWTPEGIAMSYKRDWYFVNAIGTFLESDSRRGNDAFSWGAQFGATGEFAGARLTGGVAYYSIPTQGDTTTFGTASLAGPLVAKSACIAMIICSRKFLPKPHSNWVDGRPWCSPTSSITAMLLITIRAGRWARAWARPRTGASGSSPTCTPTRKPMPCWAC
jgi:hypothetical protein